MARAKAGQGDGIEAPPEADRLGEWPHPRETAALFGHAAAERTLLEVWNSGHLHHGWLIAGEEGIGKAVLAYRFARFLLAQGEGGGSGRAGRAESLDVPVAGAVFRQTAALVHPGLFVLRRPWRPADQRFAQSIGVEDVRRLRHFLQMTPGENWRVAIVDSADDMSVNAANALLKSLEEPPARTAFLILCAAPGRLPATILSRCRRLALRPLATQPLREAVKAALARAGRKPPAEAELAQLALLADGSPRRALALLSGGGVRLHETLMDILGALPALSYGAVHRLIARLQGKDAEQDREMLFSLLGATLSRLTRAGAVGAGVEPPGLARLFTPATAGLWADLWEKIAAMRDEAGRLNLDQPALILGVFAELEKTARRCVA